MKNEDNESINYNKISNEFNESEILKKPKINNYFIHNINKINKINSNNSSKRRSILKNKDGNEFHFSLKKNNNKNISFNNTVNIIFIAKY